MIRRAICLFACLGTVIWVVGCKVHVDKNANGTDKNVRVETPFGGLRVTTGQTTAADLGLSAYPDAKLVTNDEKHKAADVRMGFGEWAMHVQVVSYTTADSQEKVTAFYRKALGRYGNVIACQDNTPVGTPAETWQGLTCADHGNPNVNVNDHGQKYGYQPDHGFQLKAGSKRHQHIVAFQSSQPGETRFTLIQLDLPANADGGQRRSD
jgi:hypothetical protein